MNALIAALQPHAPPAPRGARLVKPLGDWPEDNDRAERKRRYSRDWWDIKGRAMRLERRRAKRKAQMGVQA